MEKLKESHNASIQWRSFELRPANSPPIPEWYKEKILAARPQFEAMARAQYGIEINSGPFGQNSRKALIGAKYAEKQGKGDEYHDAMFRAYWQEAQPIADESVLQAVAEAVGLAGNDFVEALHEPTLDVEVTADVVQAQQYQITGVPALLFNSKYLVGGAQPYEELVRIIDQIKTREQADQSS